MNDYTIEFAGEVEAICVTARTLDEALAQLGFAPGEPRPVIERVFVDHRPGGAGERKEVA
jgi:hypothetical protein